MFSIIYYNLNVGHMYYDSNCYPDKYIDHLYFSTTVMTTVGFGDIVPKSSLAKITVMIQELIVIILTVALVL